MRWLSMTNSDPAWHTTSLLLTLQLTPHGSIYDSSLAAAQNRPIVSPKNVSFLTFFEGKQRPRKRWDGGMSNGDIFESSHVIYAPFVGRTLWQWSLLIRLMVLKIPFDPLWNKCNDEWEMNIRDPCSTCSTLQRGLCLSGGGVGGGGLSPSVLWVHQLYHLSVLPFAAPWLLLDSKSVV